MELRQIVGDRVRRQRMALGLSQTELAAQTAIPYQVLSRLEHGRQSLYMERLVALSRHLQVSVDYLVGLTDSTALSTRRRQAVRSSEGDR